MNPSQLEKGLPPIRQCRPVYRCALLVGIMLILLAALHAVLGLNEILSAIRVGDIGKDFAVTIMISWIFTGLALFLIGAWILFLSKDLKRLERKAWWQGFFVAGSLSAFGGACWYYFPQAYFLIGFMLIGLILLIPLLLYAPRYFSKR